MKYFLYLVSGLIFSWGLLLSGMTQPDKVKGFLELGSANWSPALLFVLAPAALVYLILYKWMQKKSRTWSGTPFATPANKGIDLKLLLGSVLFGAGWGLSGVCPGPALVNIVFADLGLLVFIVMMFFGFEIQRRMT